MHYHGTLNHGILHRGTFYQESLRQGIHQKGKMYMIRRLERKLSVICRQHEGCQVRIKKHPLSQRKHRNSRKPRTLRARLKKVYQQLINTIVCESNYFISVRNIVQAVSKPDKSQRQSQKRHQKRHLIRSQIPRVQSEDQSRHML